MKISRKKDFKGDPLNRIQVGPDTFEFAQDKHLFDVPADIAAEAIAHGEFEQAKETQPKAGKDKE